MCLNNPEKNPLIFFTIYLLFQNKNAGQFYHDEKKNFNFNKILTWIASGCLSVRLTAVKGPVAGTTLTSDGRLAFSRKRYASKLRASKLIASSSGILRCSGKIFTKCTNKNKLTKNRRRIAALKKNKFH